MDVSIIEVEKNNFIPLFKIADCDGNESDSSFAWRTNRDQEYKAEFMDMGEIRMIKHKPWRNLTIKCLAPFGIETLNFWDIYLNPYGYSLLRGYDKYNISVNDTVNALMILFDYKLINSDIEIFTDHGSRGRRDADETLKSGNVVVFLFEYGGGHRCYAKMGYETFLNADFRKLDYHSIDEYILQLLPNKTFQKGILDEFEKLKFLELLFKTKINRKKRRHYVTC